MFTTPKVLCKICRQRGFVFRNHIYMRLSVQGGSKNPLKLEMLLYIHSKIYRKAVSSSPVYYSIFNHSRHYGILSVDRASVFPTSVVMLVGSQLWFPTCYYLLMQPGGWGAEYTSRSCRISFLLLMKSHCDVRQYIVCCIYYFISPN